LAAPKSEVIIPAVLPVKRDLPAERRSSWVSSRRLGVLIVPSVVYWVSAIRRQVVLGNEVRLGNKVSLRDKVDLGDKAKNEMECSR
jgi:hypothetical protein